MDLFTKLGIKLFLRNFSFEVKISLKPYVKEKKTSLFEVMQKGFRMNVKRMFNVTTELKR